MSLCCPLAGRVCQAGPLVRAFNFPHAVSGAWRLLPWAIALGVVEVDGLRGKLETPEAAACEGAFLTGCATASLRWHL